MNIYQTNYLKAKALYEAVNAEVGAALQPHYHLLDEDKIDEFIDIETKIRDEYHQEEIWQARTAAEKALLNWGYEWTKKQAQYKRNQADLDKVWTTAIKRTHPNITEKIVDLTLRLAA